MQAKWLILKRKFFWIDNHPATISNSRVSQLFVGTDNHYITLPHSVDLLYTTALRKEKKN